MPPSVHSPDGGQRPPPLAEPSLRRSTRATEMESIRPARRGREESLKHRDRAVASQWQLYLR